MHVNKKLTLVLCAFFTVLLGSVFMNHQLASLDKSSENTASRSDNDQLIESKNSEERGRYKIVIDPGHGGEDPGATGASGLYEKDFTLSLSKEIARALEKEPEIDVYMTREDDRFISSDESERPMFANDHDADLFLSIHGNTFETAEVTGTTTFYYWDSSRAFAETMHRHVLGATGFDDRGVLRGNFFVIREATMPAVLLEIGYLTNPEEERQMLDKPFQQSLARSITAGVKEYLEIE